MLAPSLLKNPSLDVSDQPLSIEFATIYADGIFLLAIDIAPSIYDEAAKESSTDR